MQITREPNVTFDQFLQEICPPLDLESRKYRRRSPRRQARRRVDARMEELNLHGYDEYLQRLLSDAAERSLLPDLMRVTMTRFFREEKAWRELKERVIPDLLGKSGAGNLRAWSAGCCGGEEAYSLALLWLQYLRPLYPAWTIEVIATDIDAESLERARRAVYQSGSLREVPEEIRNRWFSRRDNLWHLGEEAKSLVTFKESNLLTDQPPVEIDLVLCRYLAFTYYKGERQRDAAQKLWESLRPGGILMVGAKEALLPPALQFFEPLPESRFFYRRRM